MHELDRRLGAVSSIHELALSTFHFTFILSMSFKLDTQRRQKGLQEIRIGGWGGGVLK